MVKLTTVLTSTLASAGGDAVAVIGYLDQGGKGIIQGSLDLGAFDTFILSDGMIGDSLTDTFGKSLNKSFGSLPGSLGKGAGVFKRLLVQLELTHLVRTLESPL